VAKRDLDLRELLDIPAWEAVQDRLAELTGTAVVTIDYKGTPITKHSGRTEFCGVIRENPVSCRRCHRCDALAGLEAVRLGRPYIYLCHCGIVDVAVPVVVGDRYLGAVMFGQVRIPYEDADGKVDRLVSEISRVPEGKEEAYKKLLELYGKIPRMEYSQVVKIAELMESLVGYLVEREIRHKNDTQTYQWLLRMNEIGGPDGTELQELRPPEPVKEKLPGQMELSKSSPVYPAVAYIHSHLGESVSMNAMANLCHLSPSYFSRLFRREVGEGFTDYIGRRKVQQAKWELRNTSKSISQISMELGYMNTSYFINLFKRFEGITPLSYRQNQY
jgi:ligand-binding sensor protein/AraC-like DNA-binding protein